jgi:N-acetylneuraminate synthase/N,N'-diacetyllegionaminate synthase
MSNKLNSIVRIRDREIGAGRPVFVIAEAGVNHNGDMDMARALIDAAINAGADAVKFQTFKSERLVSSAAPKADYQLQTTDRAESQAEMIRRLELREEHHHALMDYCAQRGILFLSTPFDEESADLLAELGVPAFKTSSGDVNNIPFLEHLARKGLPVIFSTGMSHLDEVEQAVSAMSAAGGDSVVILHCVTDYPTNPADVNLKAIDTLAAAFPSPIGFSDHTLGIHIPVAAVARGACVVEKHLTLDRTLPGPDHRASLEPGQLAEMISAIRETEAALGDGVKQPRGGEIGNIAIARKSLHWRRAVTTGQSIQADDLIALRPGSGISPAGLRRLVGRTIATDVSQGAMVREEDFQ